MTRQRGRRILSDIRTQPFIALHPLEHTVDVPKLCKVPGAKLVCRKRVCITQPPEHGSVIGTKRMLARGFGTRTHTSRPRPAATTPLPDLNCQPVTYVELARKNWWTVKMSFASTTAPAAEKV